MKCINCLHENTQVSRSQATKKGRQIWRRRSCTNCGATFTTYEKPDTSKLVVKDTLSSSSNKSPSVFNLSKLTASIFEAIEPSDPEYAKNNSLWIATTIEDKICNKTEITKNSLTTLTYNTIKALSEIAALQYAASHGLISSLRRPGRPPSSFRL